MATTGPDQELWDEHETKAYVVGNQDKFPHASRVLRHVLQTVTVP